MAKSDTELQDYGQPLVYSGTANATAAATTPTKVPKSTRIVNDSMTENLSFNFDNGSNWGIVLPKAQIPVYGPYTSIYLKAPTGKTVNYSLIIDTKPEGAV